MRSLPTQSSSYWPVTEEKLRPERRPYPVRITAVADFVRVLYELVREGVGRDAEIRTRDPLNPIQVRYQAAPRPDRELLSRRLRIEEGKDLAGLLEGLLDPRAQRLYPFRGVDVKRGRRGCRLRRRLLARRPGGWRRLLGRGLFPGLQTALRELGLELLLGAGDRVALFVEELLDAPDDL